LVSPLPYVPVSAGEQPAVGVVHRRERRDALIVIEIEVAGGFVGREENTPVIGPMP